MGGEDCDEKRGAKGLRERECKCAVECGEEGWGGEMRRSTKGEWVKCKEMW